MNIKIKPPTLNSASALNVLLIPLTSKEKLVLEFLEAQMGETGVCPSFQEIRDHFGFASFNSVQNYIKQLSQKGYVKVSPHQKRGLQILKSAESLKQNVQSLKSSYSPSPKSSGRSRIPSYSAKTDSKNDSKLQNQKSSRAGVLQTQRGEVLSIPLLGSVAAGQPIEEYTFNEEVDVPPSLIRNPDKSYALRVKGQSMIEEGIMDGDLILVQKQNNVSDGEIVVATVDGESTVKRIYSNKDQVELRPSNATMNSLWYTPDQVQINGVVVALLRRF